MSSESFKNFILQIFKTVVITITGIFIAFFILKTFFVAESNVSRPVFLIYSLSYAFLAFAFIFLFASFLEEDSPQELSIKDTIKFSISSPNILRLYCILCLFCSGYFVNKQINIRQTKIEIEKIDNLSKLAGLTRSSYKSESSWIIARGINFYEKQFYDEALEIFSQNPPTDINKTKIFRWRFYEAMTLFRIELIKLKSLAEINEVNTKRILKIFDDLVQNHSENPAIDNIYYWRGHAKYTLRKDSSRALLDFMKVRSIYSDREWGIWREGAIFYSAKILLSKNNENSDKEALRILSWLLSYNPNGLIKDIPDMRDKSVISMTRRLLKEHNYSWDDLN